MSNALSVRRVMVQTIDEKGNPEGPPTYGVMAADDHAQAYNDTFESLASLNDAINNSPSILSIVDDGELFMDADHAIIGRANFYGDHWTKDDINIG